METKITRNNKIQEQKPVIEPFILERYRYILQEIHTLNENIHKYLSLFQTLATAIVGGGIAIFLSWHELKVTPEVAKAGIRGLLWMLTLLAMFVVLSVIAGVFSWRDYRKEEVELLNKTLRTEFRKAPSFGNWWRWYETYIVVFVILAVIGMFVFVETQIIPLIK